MALGAGIALLRAGRAAQGAAAAVTIDNFAFGPATLTVVRGTTVTWTNDDGDVHTVRSVDGPQGFRSEALDTGDAFRMRFDRAGTYRYICSIHPQMRGTVVVE